MTIHLPFFIISIVTYITIVNKSFYKQHPLLFSLYTCVCILLLFVFILLFLVLYSMISHLIDDYFIQAKKSDGNDKGNSSGPGSGPQQEPSGGGGGPNSDTSYIYPGSDKKKGKEKEKKPESVRTSHIITVTEEYAREGAKVINNPNLSNHERSARLDVLTQKRDELSSKSSSSYELAQHLAAKEFYINKINELQASNLSENDKTIKYLEIMKQDSNADARYKKKVSDVGSSGHSREFKSIDETSTGSKGLPRDMTAPDLGGFERSQEFEEKSRQPFGLDGTTDYPRNKESNLEVPVGQGLEVDNDIIAPEFSTRKEDLQPDSNPAASQMDKSKVDPLSTVYSPPASPRKRDILKNIFKKGK